MHIGLQATVYNYLSVTRIFLMPKAIDHLFVLAPSMAILCLAGLLGICWLFLRHQKFLLWQCCSYAFLTIPLGFQTIARPAVLNQYALITGTLYLLGAWFLTKSWTERWRVAAQPKAALIISIATAAAIYHFSQNVPSLWARLYILSAGTGLIMLIPIVATIRAARPKDWLDQILLVVSLVFMGFTFTRPLLISWFNFKDPAEYTDSAYWLLSSMSILIFALIFTVVTVLIAIQETVTELRYERDHDVLTKALNRRAFHESARKVIGDKRCHPIAVLSCDIDHFKRINDTWGHDQGDKTLQAVSLCLQRNVREHDLVARMGGEEFVLLLTRIDLHGAEHIAQRIQQELKSDGSVLPPGFFLTLSFGITAVKYAEHFQHALKEADELLYSAKNAGRDRVHVQGNAYPGISFENTRPLGSV
jgi:diguanylate cyclase (GGDEF)-like protein